MHAKGTRPKRLHHVARTPLARDSRNSHLHARAQRPERPQTAPAQSPCSSCWTCRNNTGIKGSVAGGPGKLAALSPLGDPAARPFRAPPSNCRAALKHTLGLACPAPGAFWAARTRTKNVFCKKCVCSQNKMVGSPVQHQVHLGHRAVLLKQLLQVGLVGCSRGRVDGSGGQEAGRGLVEVTGEKRGVAQRGAPWR